MQLYSWQITYKVLLKIFWLTHLNFLWWVLSLFFLFFKKKINKYSAWVWINLKKDLFSSAFGFALKFVGFLLLLFYFDFSPWFFIFLSLLVLLDFNDFYFLYSISLSTWLNLGLVWIIGLMGLDNCKDQSCIASKKKSWF